MFPLFRQAFFPENPLSESHDNSLKTPVLNRKALSRQKTLFMPTSCSPCVPALVPTILSAFCPRPIARHLVYLCPRPCAHHHVNLVPALFSPL